MSEYEMANLLSEYSTAIGFQLSIFMSSVFAMMAASYFAASKLNKITSGLLVTIYSLFSFLQIMPILEAVKRLRGMHNIINEYLSHNPQSSLSAISASFGGGFGDVLRFILLAILLMTYVGTLFFYFSCRKKDA